MIDLSKFIVLETDDFIVLNKPSGVVVNKSLTTKSLTVQEWWASVLSKQKIDNDWYSLIPEEFDDSYGDPVDIFKQRQGIVHRLDKNTSGNLILAKNPGSLINLLYQFKTRQVKKVYLTLVHGIVEPKQGQIRFPISRNHKSNKKFRVDVARGRIAITNYTTIENIQGNFLKQKVEDFLYSNINKDFELKRFLKKLQFYEQGASFLFVNILTGRTHQIRVHFSHIKHPVVSDDTYAGVKRHRMDKIWCKRQFLHSFYMDFLDPRTHEKVQVVSFLHDDLLDVCKLLNINCKTNSLFNKLKLKSFI